MPLKVWKISNFARIGSSRLYFYIFLNHFCSEIQILCYKFAFGLLGLSFANRAVR